jgi:hypothetical protein
MSPLIFAYLALKFALDGNCPLMNSHPYPWRIPLRITLLFRKLFNLFFHFLYPEREPIKLMGASSKFYALSTLNYFLYGLYAIDMLFSKRSDIGEGYHVFRCENQIEKRK